MKVKGYASLLRVIGKTYDPTAKSQALAKARHIQRAAASPLSSGRVLKVMAACGAIRWTAFTTASNY